MASVNKIQIIGHTGKDVEVIQVGDTSVSKFSVAVTDSWKDKSGVKQEHTEWFNIEAWGKLGEICSEYLHKGKQIYIEGKIKTDIWEDDNGNKRYSPKVIASNMQMLGSKGDSQQDAPTDTSSTPPETDDIPF